MKSGTLGSLLRSGSARVVEGTSLIFGYSLSVVGK
jgi:hypothetical protein